MTSPGEAAHTFAKGHPTHSELSTALGTRSSTSVEPCSVSRAPARTPHDQLASGLESGMADQHPKPVWGTDQMCRAPHSTHEHKQCRALSFLTRPPHNCHFFFFFFETVSHYVAQGGLELMVLLLSLPTAGITGAPPYSFGYSFDSYFVP
jgi:hypothetical protein